MQNDGDHHESGVLCRSQPAVRSRDRLGIGCELPPALVSTVIIVLARLFLMERAPQRWGALFF